MLKNGTIIFNKYQIIKQIGVGGMSIVYLASEIRTGEKWAVKVIDKQSKEFKAMANEQGKLTEIEIVKDLDHPFIPSVNDLFEDERFITIVMEYVDGCSLKEVIDKEGPIDEDSVVKWGKALCEIFIYLHTRQEPVIYKDLKPANIMLKQNGEIKLLDFGIAVIMHEDGSLSNEKPLGTKGFASPEHFKGKVDERSDIYTLGMTLYSLITGTSPTAKDFKRDKISSIVEVNPRLEEIIEKAIRLNPKDRYQSVSEILKDLVTYKQKRPAKKSSNNNKYVIISLIIVLIAAALIAITVFLISSKDKSDSAIKNSGLTEITIESIGGVKA